MGGVIYHYLGLPFSSPCVNILWEKEEYFKLMQAPLMYLEKELIMVREGDLRNGIWPVGQLGEGSESVKMQFVHSINFDDAKVQWDKRKERINKNNLFIKMGFNGFDDRKDIWLEEFKKVPYKKVCFFNGERGENIFASERFLIKPIRMGRSVEYYSYMDWCRNYSYLGIDILKLLVGDKDYLREGYEGNR